MDPLSLKIPWVPKEKEKWCAICQHLAVVEIIFTHSGVELINSHIRRPIPADVEEVGATVDETGAIVMETRLTDVFFVFLANKAILLLVAFFGVDMMAMLFSMS